jgi:hypothetical protein
MVSAGSGAITDNIRKARSTALRIMGVACLDEVVDL